MVFGGDKKSAKKRFLWKRKQRDLLMHRFIQDREREEERVEALEEQRQPRKPSKGEPGSAVTEAEIWSAKTQEIRNKLDGKKRMAEERWNRFAGTSDAGAKGL